MTRKDYERLSELANEIKADTKVEVYKDKHGHRLGYKLGKYYAVMRRRGEWFINTTGERYAFISDLKRAKENGEYITTVGGVEVAKRKLKELYFEEV